MSVVVFRNHFFKGRENFFSRQAQIYYSALQVEGPTQATRAHWGAPLGKPTHKNAHKAGPHQPHKCRFCGAPTLSGSRGTHSPCACYTSDPTLKNKEGNRRKPKLSGGCAGPLLCVAVVSSVSGSTKRRVLAGLVAVARGRDRRVANSRVFEPSGSLPPT